MTEGADKPRKGSKRLRKLGVAALMVGGSAGAAATIGGHAFAKAICSSPGDQEANASFSKLPNGVDFTLCNGTLNGTVDPGAVIANHIGKVSGVPDVALPIVKIHATFPAPSIPKIP